MGKFQNEKNKNSQELDGQHNVNANDMSTRPITANPYSENQSRLNPQTVMGGASS